ncbi:MAG: VanZ family protein, partial [Phycisphaerales bacterium]|nr:VanZ family protein [Phycisphaerales bacterium]
ILNDKLMHLVGYGGLGFATMWTLAIRRRRASLWPGFFGAWVAMLCYALFDESTQPIVGRSFEWSDLAADATGAALGLLLALLIVRRRG